MNWTADKPRQDGWWWYRGEHHAPVPMRVWERETGLWWVIGGAGHGPVDLIPGEWAGPILPPESSKDK